MSITNKFLIWLSRVWYVVWIIPVPIGYLIWKYNKVQTTTVDVTTNSMPIWILLVIAFLSFLFVTLVGVNLIVFFWEYIKKNIFGFITTSIFALLILLFTLNGMGAIDKLQDLIKNSVDEFLVDMTTWRGSLVVISYYVVIGAFGGALGFVYELAVKLKLK
jgi:hypothetical protein